MKLQGNRCRLKAVRALETALHDFVEEPAGEMLRHADGSLPESKAYVASEWRSVADPVPVILLEVYHRSPKEVHLRKRADREEETGRDVAGHSSSRIRPENGRELQRLRRCLPRAHAAG